MNENSGSDIPHFDITIDRLKPDEQALNLVCKLKPSWTRTDIQLKYFTTGISNFLFGCYCPTDADDMVLIRIYGQKTELFIDRKAELEAFRILHAAGCSAPVYCTFTNGMAYGYLKGKPLTQEMAVYDKKIQRLIAKEMAKLHSLKGPAVGENVLYYFKKMEIFFSHCPEKFSDPEMQKKFEENLGSKKNLQEEFAVLTRHLEKMDCPVVYSHNDLLLQNILYDETCDKVCFIDYEYTFYNYQPFDIGNHFNEYVGMEEIDYKWYPSEQQQLSWIRTYLDYFNKFTQDNPLEVTDEDVQSFYVMVNLCSLASHFLWGVWALIQAEYSEIDFDFLEYSVTRFKEYFRRRDQVFDLK